MSGRKAELNKLKRGQKKFVKEQEKLLEQTNLLGICDGNTKVVNRTASPASKRYPQPPIKAVYNNRVVFGAGVVTGLVIGIWVSMFLCNFIPMVLS